MHRAICLRLEWANTLQTSLLVAALLLLLLPGVGLTQDKRIDFATDVQPILTAKCVRCHGPKKQEGGLRLDVRRRVFAGGDTAAAVVPGKAIESELIRRLTTTDEEHRMPPSGPPLEAAQLARIRAWIEQGATWPDALAGQESYSHWAFQPVQRPELPSVRNAKVVRNPIDAFVLARLEKQALAFSPEADVPTLLRRLHLDLLGLPPSVEQLEQFQQSAIRNPQAAIATVVDELLASPHFGERWGRHWLDLARFGESDGYENDNLRPNAWRFRDWVCDAINQDLPFDRFTIEQLAGDLLPDATPTQKIATGFHCSTLWNSAASADKEEFRTRAIKDRVDTTGAAWMGLTLGCAQCHSHKYDPVSQREYYQLYAFFNSTNIQNLKLTNGDAAVLHAVKRPSFVHRRGNFLARGADVSAETPAFLPPLKPRGAATDRLDLARWLVNPQHPLTARVAVNHCWQHLFGVGLVSTPENFGMKGTPPSHPELLDWLASEFVRLKWSRKALLRTIVLSTTYRQASVQRPELTKVDPDNRLLGRQNRYRVEAEIIRDLALSASGLLDRKLGGPSIVPPFPDGLLAQRFGAESLKMPGEGRHRRSFYIHVQRTLPHPVLSVFDGTDGNQTCPRRDRSTTPLQALTLLNDPIFAECYQALGQKLRMAGKERDERLRTGFSQCLGRQPSTAEMAVLTRLVDNHQKLGANEDTLWQGVARTLMNLDEFITRE